MTTANAAAAPEPARSAGADEWQILRALVLYRLVLIGTLLVIYHRHIAPHMIGETVPALFTNTCYAYGAAGIVWLVTVLRRMPNLPVQAWLQFLTDAAGISLLIYSSGGVGSGLGMLLITPAVGCALVLPRRIGVALAALAALALLGEETLRQLHTQIDAAAFTEAGFLGAIFFIVALTANAVAVRARKSEADALRFGNELVNLSRLNESIVETLQAGVIVVDGERRVRLLNRAARQLLRSPADPTGYPLASAAPRLAQALDDWASGRNPEPNALTPRRGAAEVLPRFSRLGTGANAPVLVLIDDARRVRSQAQQLKLAALGRLSASIAHEIRNPLSAIAQAGQLLAEDPRLSADGARMLAMIHRQAGRIDKIIRDVLALSRRDAAAQSAIPLRPWLAQCVRHYRETFPDENREIALDGVPENLSVRFDESHLQQVLANLWDNSFGHGGVHVTLRAGWLPDDGRVWLESCDDGPGIPADAADQIFEPFYTTSHGGIGLGLHLARELCEYNHARLEHVPGAGPGACFRVIFADEFGSL